MKRTALVLSIGMLLSGASVFAGPDDKPVEAKNEDVKNDADAKPKTKWYSHLTENKGRITAFAGVVVVAGIAYTFYKNCKKKAAQLDEEIV